MGGVCPENSILLRYRQRADGNFIFIYLSNRRYGQKGSKKPFHIRLCIPGSETNVFILLTKYKLREACIFFPSIPVMFMGFVFCLI